MKARNLKISLARLATEVAGRLAFRKRGPGDYIPVLCYHRVLPSFIEGDVPIYSILPEQFESQMAFLADEGFESLSLQEFIEMAQGLRPYKKSVLITFDDGYADNYFIAHPIAEKYKIKINLFICTSNVGVPDPILFSPSGYSPVQAPGPLNEWPRNVVAHIHDYPHLWRPLNWEELREMGKSGVQIGFHSHRHHRLSHLTQQELISDIIAGLSIFEKNLGYRPQAIALPYGWYDSYTPMVIRCLKDFGLDFIFTTHMKVVRLPCDQFVFPRIYILQEDDQMTFQRKLLGEYDWLETVGRLSYQVRHLLERKGSFS